MPAISSALVIGGGAAGTAAAILLAQGGVSVDLVELSPAPPAQGSGITLQGNALRVLRELGLWDEVSTTGYGFNSLGIRAPDPAGTLLAELPDVRSGGPDLPATLGMPRPDLARLLLGQAAASGAKVRFGTSVVGLDQDEHGVDVQFADGGSGRYDLVIAADGIRSSTRSMLGVDLHTRATGMGIWRVQTHRPESVVRTDLTYGGRCLIAGYCPTSEDSLYAYVVEPAQDRTGLSQAERIAVFLDLSSGYHGPWDPLRAGITDETYINYTRFETHFLEGPWNRGRVVLIGDAAHACPPTIAQGAALALEDSSVLSSLLLSSDRVDDALWAEFTARRSDRVRQVVDASVQVGQWMLDGVRPPEADVPGTFARIGALMATTP